MPVELKVLGYAALLQFVQFIVMAIPVNVQLGVAYTGGNRDEQKRATGVAGRLKRALENHFEGLILFTIAVLVVTLGDASSQLTEYCAWAYLWARVLYVPAYASGVFLVRSLIWSVGFIATGVMLIAALARSTIGSADAHGHRNEHPLECLTPIFQCNGWPSEAQIERSGVNMRQA